MPPVPRGGSKTPLNVTFQYGNDPGRSPYYPPGDRRLYGQADLTRFPGAAQAFLPETAYGAGGSGIFAPNYPPVPWGPEATWTWEYEVGRNLIWTPRPYEAVKFGDLEALAQWHDITRLAIETRKDQIEKFGWSVKPKDERDASADADGRAQQVMELFERPEANREKDFTGWLRENIEQVLVTDAPALEIRRNRGGDVIGFDIVKGTTLTRLIDHTGRTPDPPLPYLLQTIHGRPWKLLTKSDVIYRPRNLRPGKLYGMSPVEQIVTTVNIALRRQYQQLDYFTESNIPKGLISGPSDWTPEQLAGYQTWFDNLLQGNIAERTKLIWGPAGARYIPFKDSPFKDDFDEWLARVVCFAFSLPPTAFTRQINRATAETAQEAAMEEGLAPLMGWVKRLIDHLIQVVLAQPDLEFSWDVETPLDPAEEAKIYDVYVGNATMSRNEVRDRLGLDPDPDGDVLTLKAAQTGAVTLESVIHPPEPPPMPALGMDGGDGAPDGPPKPGVPKPKPANQNKPAPKAKDNVPLPQKEAVLRKQLQPARTLYVNRPVLNVDEILAWAKRQGFPFALNDLHVTIAYSKRPLPWDAAGKPDSSMITLPMGVDRSVEMLGDKGAVVLRFTAPELEDRWQDFVMAGASWDYDEYRPHMTLTYDSGGLLASLDEVVPYYGELVLGPEEWAELDTPDHTALEVQLNVDVPISTPTRPGDQINPDMAGYVDQWNGVDQCQRCSMFRPLAPDGPGCDLVTGRVSATGHCNFYALSAEALAAEKSKAARHRELVHAEAIGLLAVRRDRALLKRVAALEAASHQPLNLTIPVNVDARRQDSTHRTGTVTRQPDGSLAIEQTEG